MFYNKVVLLFVKTAFQFSSDVCADFRSFQIQKYFELANVTI